MCKKIILILALLTSSVGFIGCREESVKYISSEADVTTGVSEEQDEDDLSTVAASTGQASYGAEQELSDDAIEETNLVPVYVCGAVNNPGVYYMSPDSLKAEALSLAGGLAEDAALDYVNLAETVISGEKIYFPYSDELSEGANISSEDDSQEASGKVNINTATKDELMTLPGIGESKAEAIIKYREEHGPFQSIEDITNISGIKEGVYNNIKDYIIVN